MKEMEIERRSACEIMSSRGHLEGFCFLLFYFISVFLLMLVWLLVSLLAPIKRQPCEWAHCGRVIQPASVASFRLCYCHFNCHSVCRSQPKAVNTQEHSDFIFVARNYFMPFFTASFCLSKSERKDNFSIAKCIAFVNCFFIFLFFSFQKL